MWTLLPLLVGGVVEAAVEADKVTSLPGWKGALPSTHYSGYIPVRNGQHHVCQLGAIMYDSFKSKFGSVSRSPSNLPHRLLLIQG
jgi:hypothetical protein